MGMLVAILPIGLLLALAGAYGWVRYAETRAPRLVCLMYHRFVTDADYGRLSGDDRIYSIPLPRFEAQLRRLNELGYRSVTADAAAAFARGESTPPQPSVLITIDDGCRCALEHAQPLLRKYGHRAILYVTTDARAYVFGRDDPLRARLTDDELRRLDPEVIEVGSHTVTHRPLTSLSETELAAELRDSRATLERVVGRPVRHLAAPGGWYDRRTRDAAAAAGYAGVCVSDVGSVRPGSDPLAMPRVNIAGYNTLAAFEDALSPAGLARRRFSKTLRRLPQQIVGAQRWEAFRQQVALPGTAGGRAALAIGLVLVLVMLAAGAWRFLRAAR